MDITNCDFQFRNALYLFPLTQRALTQIYERKTEKQSDS
jgi:hypothetical protein